MSDESKRTERMERAERAERSNVVSWDKLFQEPQALNWWRSAEPFVRMNAIMLKGTATLCEEMESFTKARLHHNVETERSMSRCKTAAEMMNLQRDFTRAAAEQYIDLSTKLMKLAAEVAQESLTPLQEPLRAAVTSLRSA